MMSMSTLWSMVIWTGFNLVFPLTPIGLVRFIYWIKNIDKGFLYIIGDGQICFVCTAMSVGTMYDAFKVKDVVDERLSLSMVVLVISLLVSSSVFVLAATESDVEDRPMRLKISLVSFYMTMVVTIFILCIRFELGLFNT